MTIAYDPRAQGAKELRAWRKLATAPRRTIWQRLFGKG